MDIQGVNKVSFCPFRSNFTSASFVSKEFKFTLEAIVQVAGSLRTKSLDPNQKFNLKDLPVAVTNTDLKPIKNDLQRIKH